MKNLVFCEECRKEVTNTVAKKAMIGKIKGVEYQYIGKEARCSHCGTLVYVPEINDSNLKALYDVYREKNGIVSLEIIRAIPEKYEITNSFLSHLLGSDEQTFTRYYEGDIPSKQHSEILTKIYENPEYYADICKNI